MADIFSSTITDFIAYSRGVGFAKASKFGVQITKPRGLLGSPIDDRVISMLCQEASFPGKSIASRNLRINSLTEQRAATADYLNEISLVFLVDNSWTTMRFFEAWTNLCVANFRNSTSTREVGFYGDYAAEEMIIFALRQNNSEEQPESVSWAVKLKEVWPRALSGLPVEHSSANTFIRLPVTFTYKYWELLPEYQTNITV